MKWPLLILATDFVQMFIWFLKGQRYEEKLIHFFVDKSLFIVKILLNPQTKCTESFWR